MDLGAAKRALIVGSFFWFFTRYYKWILERNFQNLNKGVRGNQVFVTSFSFKQVIMLLFLCALVISVGTFGYFLLATALFYLGI
jgi:hypothetical protein